MKKRILVEQLKAVKTKIQCRNELWLSIMPDETVSNIINCAYLESLLWASALGVKIYVKKIEVSKFNLRLFLVSFWNL